MFIFIIYSAVVPKLGSGPTKKSREAPKACVLNIYSENNTLERNVYTSISFIITALNQFLANSDYVMLFCIYM